MNRCVGLSFCLLLALSFGCSTSSRESRQDELSSAVEVARKRVLARDPSLKARLEAAHGYAIFPSVGKGGVIVGGAYGRGEVFENGVLVGWADILQPTVGAQLGGQTYTELIVFQDERAMENFKIGKLKIPANVSAVALASGAAASATFSNGVIVFVEPREGLALEAAVGGQSFSFLPK